MKCPKRAMSLGLFAFILILNFACGNSSVNKEGTQSASPLTHTPAAEGSPTPGDQPRSGDLVQAASSGEVRYELSGYDAGDSTRMNLDVRNKSERDWEVKIEIGTKLEPDEVNVQQMVVTKEVEVHLEPHDHETLEIEVSCLDISKAPPSKTNTKWRVENSNNLSQFIRCANQVADQLEEERKIGEESRRGVIQAGLWNARGASRDDWIHYFQEYRNFSTEQAEQALAESEPVFKTITNRCPSL